MLKKILSVTLLFCFVTLPFFAADMTAQNQWVLAAQKYTFPQKNKRSGSVEQFATILPQLILEQISIEGTRVLPSQEVLDRKLDALQTERLSLFLQLSKEYQARDALVVNTAQPKKLEKALEAAQTKINDIQKKIDENLAQTEKEKADFKPKINREEAIARGERVEDTNENRWHFPFPFFADEEESPKNEVVTLYRNDATALFTPSETAVTDGITSRAYEKELTSAKINGLLCGSIKVYGDYAAVTTDLYVFPGSKLVGTVTEVGTIGDQMDFAERIVQQLVPKITNSLPVNLHFEIEPAEITAKASLTIDGLVYSKIPSDMQVDASVHTIAVEAKGYDTASFTYKFEGNERYRIKIALSPARSGSLNLRLKKLGTGIFYARGLETLSVDPQNSAAPITVNGKSVLGIYTTGTGEDAKSAFFYIPENLASDGANVKVNAKPFDRAENIDKRRRWLYTAYTAFICSMPFTFYFMGNDTASAKAYNRDGRISYDEAAKWQTGKKITAGISIACGVWLAYELIRYLYAANQVLPATASVDKRDFTVPVETEEIVVGPELPEEHAGAALSVDAPEDGGDGKQGKMNDGKSEEKSKEKSDGKND